MSPLSFRPRPWNRRSSSPIVSHRNPCSSPDLRWIKQSLGICGGLPSQGRLLYQLLRTFTQGPWEIYSVLDMRNPQKPPWPSSTSVLSVTRVTPFSVWSKLIFQYVWLWVKCKDLDCRFQLFFIVTGRFVSWPSWKPQKSWGVLDHLHPVNNGKQFLSSLCV
jgi:hypothetical protein